MRKLICFILVFHFFSSVCLSAETSNRKTDLNKYITITTKKMTGTVVLDSALFPLGKSIFEAEISKSYINNFALVSVNSAKNYSKDIHIVMDMNMEMTNDFNFKDSTHIKSGKFETIICPDSVSNSIATVKTISVSIYSEVRPSEPITLEYEIILKSAIISWRAIIYLLFVLIFVTVFLYYLKWDRFCRIAGRSTNVRWNRVISILSQIFLIILLFDEIGLLLKEWNISSGFFSVFRGILELPGLSQILLIANLGLVIPAGYSLTSALISQIKESNENLIKEWEDFEQFKERYSLASSMLILSFSLLFFLIQCFTYDEFKISGGDGIKISFSYIIIILSGPVIALFVLLRNIRRISKESNPYRNQPWYEKDQMFIIVLVCFLSLTQTMITKVLLLLSIVNWSKPLIFKYLTSLVAKVKSHSRVKQDHSYESVINNLSKSSLVEKWNFLFLTLSFLPLMLLFQIHCSPYPPSDSAYPKTETISALYMLYMILFLFIGRNPATVFFKSVIWMAISIFTLYITPILFESWYFPSLNPPGFSILEAISQLSNVWLASGFALSIHLIVTFIFLILYYSADLKQQLYSTNYTSIKTFKKYFFIRIYLSDLIFFFLFPALMLIFANSDMYKSMKFLSSMGFSIVDFSVIDPVLVLFPGCILAILSIDRKNTVVEIRDEILENSNAENLARIKKEFPFVNNYKSWDPQRGKFKSFVIFLLPAFLLIILSFVAFKLPGIHINDRTKLSSYIPREGFAQPGESLFKQGNNIIWISSESISAYDILSNDAVWKFDFQVIDHEIIDEMKLCLLTKEESIMLNVETAEVLWRTKIKTADHQDVQPQELIAAPDLLTIKTNTGLLLLNERSGIIVSEMNNSAVRTSIGLGGPMLWVTPHDTLFMYDKTGSITDIGTFQDSIHKVYSFKESVITLSDSDIFCFNTEGDLLWEKKLNEGQKVWDIISKDSLVIFYDNEGVSASNMLNGNIMWKKPDNYFSQINFNAFSRMPNQSSFDYLKGKLFTLDERNLYLRDASTGEILIKFAGVNKSSSVYNHICLGLSDNLLCSFEPFKVKCYSLTSGKKLFWNFYMERVLNRDPIISLLERELSRFNTLCLYFTNNVIYLTNNQGLYVIKLSE